MNGDILEVLGQLAQERACHQGAASTYDVCNIVRLENSKHLRYWHNIKLIALFIVVRAPGRKIRKVKEADVDDFHLPVFSVSEILIGSSIDFTKFSNALCYRSGRCGANKLP